MDVPFQEKYRTLIQHLMTHKQVIVAFSGGVDSLLLLHAAVEALGDENVHAVIGASPTLPESELKEAKRLAQDIGVKLRVAETGVMYHREFISNPMERCYHCRVNLTDILSNNGLDAHDIRVMDGANTDDLSDYRPGLRAADERGVIHPLIHAGISKRDIREILAFLGYPEEVYNKPAAPCLSSRIPYGEAITREKLKRIEDSEDFLRSCGFRELRVRHLETSLGNIAIIELNAQYFDTLDSELRRKIVHHLKELGFKRVLLNIEDFRSGNLNDVIDMGV